VSRPPLVLANWKMHGTLAEAGPLASRVLEGVRRVAGVEVVLCPPFTALGRVGELLRGSSVALGAQDCHWETRGAFTGEGPTEPVPPPPAGRLRVFFSTRFTESAARRLLEGAGLRVGRVARVHAGDVSKDLVIASDPPGETLVEQGTVVNLLVSFGAPPRTSASMRSGSPAKDCSPQRAQRAQRERRTLRSRRCMRRSGFPINDISARPFPESLADRRHRNYAAKEKRPAR